MDISGSYTLYAPRERVWAALLDPDMLKQTVPGCERLDKESEGTFLLRLNIGVASVKGIYDGTLRLSDLHPPESYRMTVDGKGARGVLHGDGTLSLEARDPNTTVVSYSGQAQLGGPIAGVGMRVASGAANMLIKAYFSRLADLLGERAPVA
ncbi:MAG: SRPBCC family protein, partial [Ktedonobacterales bacterium]